MAYPSIKEKRDCDRYFTFLLFPNPCNWMRYPKYDLSHMPWIFRIRAGTHRYYSTRERKLKRSQAKMPMDQMVQGENSK